MCLNKLDQNVILLIRFRLKLLLLIITFFKFVKLHKWPISLLNNTSTRNKCHLRCLRVLKQRRTLFLWWELLLNAHGISQQWLNIRVHFVLLERCHISIVSLPTIIFRFLLRGSNYISMLWASFLITWIITLPNFRYEIWFT